MAERLKQTSSMKTTDQLKEIIAKNKHQIETKFDEIPKKELKKLVKQNTILVPLKNYLETNPKETFVVSEKERIKKIISEKESQYALWQRSTTETMSPTKQSRVFCKTTGITTLRKQLKNLNFLLSKNEQPTFR